MKRVKDKNQEVIAVAGAGKNGYEKRLKENFKFIEIPVKRSIDWKGGDLLYLWRIFRFCRKEKPDICHNFTMKPCIYGTIAQKAAGTEKIYCTVTGLGYLFQGNGFFKSIIRKAVVLLYKLAFSFADKVIFLNPEDKKLFLKLKILSEEKAELIKSSGVDLDKFSKKNVDKNGLKDIIIKNQLSSDYVVITMVARMLYEKGVEEFVEAAGILNNQRENLKFILVGPIDTHNPSGIPEKKLLKWCKDKKVSYLGRRRDIKEILFLSDIFVLPSYYGEGVPKALLEAGAMKLPLITTDHTGCREVVDDKKNGFLVEKKNSIDLKEKLLLLIDDEDLRKKMGEFSREKIKKEFNEEEVVEKNLSLYEI